MPRLLANEFLYPTANTTATDEQQYSEYNVTPSKSPGPPTSLNRYQKQHQNKIQATVSSRNRLSKSRSRSPPVQRDHSKHHVNTDLVNDNEVKSTGDGGMLSDDDEEDFKGFEDAVTPHNSETLLWKSHGKESMDSPKRKSILKRNSHGYNEDSEGAVEAIEVDDDEDIEEVDGKMLLRSKHPRTFSQSGSKSLNNYNSHTPSKKKKQQSEHKFGVSLLPSHDNQIFEINSDSTTMSQKQKRQQINSKFQRQINKQTKNTINVANKCSTESTSEFPVSSPSNPQQPRDGVGKYPPRPPLLKNTLPGDNFERHLALVTASNPQMSLAEKIQNWCCDDELSDVEDVQVFDDEFKRFEDKRKKEIKSNKNKKIEGDDNLQQCDFSEFKQKLLDNMKIQNYQRFYCGHDGGPSAGGFKDKRSTASDSSKSGKFHDDRPSTSAIAQQLQLRRLKLSNLCSDANFEEGKKRFSKDLSKRNQNSTTPPATSSSENDRDYFAKNPATVPNNRHSQSIQVHEKLLCPSSSEDANSQDAPSHEKKNVENETQENPRSKNLQGLQVEEVDSVFRLHRLNREIDKQIKDLKKLEYKKPAKHRKDEEDNPPSVMDNKKNDQNENSTKEQENFKTPIIPPKYLGNVTTTKDSSPPTKNNAIVSTGKPSSSEKESNSKVKLEDAENDSDFDGEYHQQHEFCNYLGLTGMSTATAMANAVAELAQCNLTRRSMRVLRQQKQQDRKEKSKDDSREEVATTKIKTQKDVKKHRERGGYDVPVDSEESTVFYEEGSNSQKSALSLKQPLKNKDITDPVTHKLTTNIVKSSPVTSTFTGFEKQQPQIKILCHIATSAEKKINKKTPAVSNSENPSNQTIQQEENNVNNKNNKNYILEENALDTQSNNSNPDHDEIKDDLSQADEQKKRLRISVEPNSKKKQANLKSNNLDNKGGKHQQKDSEIFENLENEKHRDLKSNPKLNSEQFKISQSQKKSSSPLRNAEHPLDECYNRSLSTTPTSANLNKEKLQAALVESRKTKPSIYIVQSLEYLKENNVKSVPSLTHSINNSNDVNKDNEAKPTKSFMSHLKIEIKRQMSDNFPSDNQSDPKQKTSKKYSAKGRKKTKKHNNSGKRKLRSHKEMYTTKKSKSEDDFSKADDKSYKSNKSKKQDKIKYSKTSLQSMQSFVSINSMPILDSDQSMQGLQSMASMQSFQTVRSMPFDYTESCTTLQTNMKKSFRNAETETEDLGSYNENNNMTRTRLMVKAAALLERSRRLSIARALNTAPKLKSKILRPSIKFRSKVHNYQHKINPLHSKNKKENETTEAAIEVDKVNDCKLQNTKSLFHSTADRNQQSQQKTTKNITMQENENVVVSSTTNSFDERPSPHHHNHLNNQIRQISSPLTLRSVHSSTPSIVNSKPIKTQDSWTQIENASVERIQYLSSPPSATHTLRNPLDSSYGMVLYMYYELDILIVVQEKLVSFWKCSRLLTPIAVVDQKQKSTLSHIQKLSHQVANPKLQFKSSDISHESLHSSTTASSVNILDTIRKPVLSSSSLNSPLKVNGEWIMLGELKRLTYDFEISAPYANRICVHNSTPIYVEMRARPLPKHHRDCNLLSMYINIYFYHDDDIVAKNNSIQLDTIQSDFRTVNYTTLKDSRYFIITWPQDNLLGKPRSGLCKYSLTPQLDTLASIREFKSMRHTIKYLECINDDKLIGFGESQLTIWDHRSGDILMNYDFEMQMGKNLGTVYCTSSEFDHKKIVILFQWLDSILPNNEPELMVIACTIAHTQPTYRILYKQKLPMAFKNVDRAINTGEHLVIIGSEIDKNEKELWISCENPSLMALVSPSTIEDCKRFYSRGRSKLLELTEKTLNVDTLANHNINIAAAGMAVNPF